MTIPTIEEICCKLDELELSGAGECEGRFLLFAPNREKAAENLRTLFDPPAGHSWMEFVRQGVFEAAPLDESERPVADVNAKAAAAVVLQAGDKVGPSASAFPGTLGGIVFDQHDEPYLLSARHSTPDDNVYEGDSKIVVVTQAVAIGQFNRFGGSTDCALGKITDGTTKASLKFPDLNQKYGYFQTNPGMAKIDEKVELCGAKTERTTVGTVVCPRYHCVLVEICGEVYKFNDQILIYGVGFSDIGDSGGIVLRNNGSSLEALGLFFAVSQGFTYSLAQPLTDVFIKVDRQLGFKPRF